jgi:acid stress chaperone HdeA
MKSLRWVCAGVGVIGVAATVLSGCSDVEKAMNKGGDTACSDYVKQDQDTQRVTITKFIKQRTNDEHEPAGTVVDATMVSVNFLCSNQRNASTPIKNADVAGIFLNK